MKDISLDDARIATEVDDSNVPRLFERGSGWVLFGTLVFATTVGLLVQWVILPALLPSLHAGHGLQAGGDWIGFHEDGVKLANALASKGWRAFELRPSGNFPAGVSGVIYFITGIQEPWVVIPLSASLFSVAVVAVFNIFCCLTSRRDAILALIPLVLFPGSIQFYSQAEKDVWSFTSSALLLFIALVVARRPRMNVTQCVSICCMVIFAAGLAWLVRPYFSSVQLAAFTCAVAFTVLDRYAGDMSLKRPYWVVFLGWCFVCMMLFATDVPSRIWPSLKNENPSDLFHVSHRYVAPASCARAPSVVDGLLPSWARRGLDSVVSARLGMVQSTGRYAGSAIDNEVCFSQPSDVIRYIPRALQIGLFAPFPNMWLSRGTSVGARAMRLISGGEMFAAYLLFPGIAFLLWSAGSRRWAMLAVLAFVLPIIILMATAIPNVGTLYRMRYGYLGILMGMGLIGLLQLRYVACAKCWPKVR